MGDSNRVALVTGGAKRVGRGIVEHLVAQQWQVAFTFWNSRDAADELVEKFGSRVLPIRVDLTKPAAAVPFVLKKFSAEFEQLHLLVNNASIYQPGDEQLMAMMAIHVEAPLRLCRTFEPMLRTSRGCVVNMADRLADRPMPSYAAYAASKAALVNLTKSLARELAPEVTVNAIAPGVVDWPPEMPAAERRKYLKRVPLARAGTPADVAKLVAFIADGGGYTTGSVIDLDGGRHLL